DPGQGVLVPRVIGSGQGPDTWADRTRLEPSPPDGHELLLLDTDRTVLEGGRSSLFMVDANGLHTPPLDDRILPGCARARVIHASRRAGAVGHQRRLTGHDLAAPGEVLMPNSLRGGVPIPEAEGIGRWSPGAMTSWVRSVTFGKPAGPGPMLSSMPGVVLIHRGEPFLGSLTHQLRAAGAGVLAVHADEVVNPDHLTRMLRGATHVLLAADSLAGSTEAALVEHLAGRTPMLGVGAGAATIA